MHKPSDVLGDQERLLTEMHVDLDVPTYTPRSRILLSVGIAVGIVFLVAIGWIFVGRGPIQNPARARMIGDINEAMARLNVKPRTVELTSEKATRARTAIMHGDYLAAHQITAEVLASSHLQNWRYYPFSDFMNGVTSTNDRSLEGRLDTWVAQSKNDAIPLLTRAQYYHDMGWFYRGHHFDRQTQADHLASFASFMTKALADIDAAIHLHDGNPYSFFLKIRILRGIGTQQDIKNAFEEAIAKYPNYYPPYDLALALLEPKWGGSVDAMYAFVDRYAGHAAEDSPLKLLYLSLYRDLLNTASTSCTHLWRDREKMTQCVEPAMQAMIKPELDAQVVAASQLYDRSDKYQFGVAVQDILLEMSNLGGGGLYAGAMLQLAESSMHDDTRLKEEKPDQNNYIIDRAASRSWYAKGFYDNALKKDQDALKDIEAREFPNEEAKDLAAAEVYGDMAWTYRQLSQYPDMIAHQKAAIALGGKTKGGFLICYGYYRLKDLDGAVQECTKAIEDEAGNLQARYWRARAYRDLDQIDAALQDFTVVADSEDNLRAYSAIAMSMIYSTRGDFQGALNVLNTHAYLYDPNLSSKADIAVSYNNRCYAYMQLGELEKALDNCTASLKYGNLPDAFRKQLELVKRLNAH